VLFFVFLVLPFFCEVNIVTVFLFLVLWCVSGCAKEESFWTEYCRGICQMFVLLDV